MNAAALTTLIDRWRPKTRTFHLRAGEMTPTLQDVSTILALPIQGEPLCMNIAFDGWRGQMEDLIGLAPPEPEDIKDRAPASAPFSWIRTHFGTCPLEADRDTLGTYTRVYLWYMLSRTLFADSGGKLTHWCWLKLDEGCRRIGSGGIGGCLLLISVWRWDRLSVGRPRILNQRPWPHYRNNPDREPTWAYTWDNVSEMTSDPIVMYMHYTEQLDTLTAEQVDWEPYGTYYRIGSAMSDLNPKCLEEAGFWLRNGGLIEVVPYNAAAFNNYLQWFHESTCIELVNHAYDEDILDDLITFDEVAQSQYDRTTRKGRSTSIASSLNFMRSEIQKTAQECEVIWDQSHKDEKPIGPLRHFIKNTARKMLRLANLLGCREGEIATSSSEEAEIPDDTILSQSISRGKKQATRSAY
ncbi:hypothetical protein QYE76_050276 [Lolium multiflorum]|uniref:Aminotransferase-like plant mobile domain-containing protein n=1 Tax=Lolium multiflorum TaxID=4521 RepID=A0AAD8SRA3_LOLMU|nr:hypothetical protein QYE76_050276 [Lolium multiflorum]